MRKIGFIGGGNMAEGIIRGLINTGTKAPEEILVREIRPERAQQLQDRYHIIPASSTRDLIQGAQILVLAVRPQDAKEVALRLGELGSGKAQVLVSICAGIQISQLTAWTKGAFPVARIMPNTMIDSRRGYSALAFGDGFMDSWKDEVRAVTNAIGKTLPLSESLFDAFTATSCAGPEWLILFATALTDAAVETGLARADAAAIVYENLIATGMLLSSTDKHPTQITDEMNTPGGIGIAGFHTFHSGGLHGLTMDAVKAAYVKTTQLGQ